MSPETYENALFLTPPFCPTHRSPSRLHSFPPSKSNPSSLLSLPITTLKSLISRLIKAILSIAKFILSLPKAIPPLTKIRLWYFRTFLDLHITIVSCMWAIFIWLPVYLALIDFGLAKWPFPMGAGYVYLGLLLAFGFRGLRALRARYRVQVPAPL